jgi:uncharacterized protein (TIGR02453 family)
MVESTKHRTAESPAARIPAAGMTLLREIEENNEPEWARAHGAAIEERLVRPFAAVLEAVSARLAREGGDLARLSGGRDTVFRVRRDLRFTSDRRPLHERVEGMLSRDRVRIGARAAIQVRLDRGGGYLSAGTFLPSAAVRFALREVMEVREPLFRRIARELEAAGAPLWTAKHLARAPRSFEHLADGPLGPYLRMVDPVARMDLRVKDWRGGEVVARAVEFARTTRRWLMFQREAFEGLRDEVPWPPRAVGHRGSGRRPRAGRAP